MSSGAAKFLRYPTRSQGDRPPTSNPSQGSSLDHVLSFCDIRKILLVDVRGDGTGKDGVCPDAILAQGNGATLHER